MLVRMRVRSIGPAILGYKELPGAVLTESRWRRLILFYAAVSAAMLRLASRSCAVSHPPGLRIRLHGSLRLICKIATPANRLAGSVYECQMTFSSRRERARMQHLLRNN